MDVILKSGQKVMQIEKQIFDSCIGEPSVSLFNGKGGLLLFYYNLYSITGKDEYRKKSSIIADQLLEQISREVSSFTYCDGLTGIGFLFNYLREKDFLDHSIDNFLQQCDEILLNAFGKVSDKSNWDYLHGASGIALYFLDRYRMVPELEGTVKKVFESFLRGLDEQEGIYTAGISNCGMAHGLVAPIMLLSKYVAVAHNADYVKSVLRKVIDRLLYFKSVDPDSISVFPSIVKENDAPNEWCYDVPLGWCYGDTTVSIGLYHAAKALEDVSLAAEAETLALHATKRNTEKTAGIYDASFCHGSASVAHIFKKWYSFTGNPDFHKSYLLWINKTLELTSFENGIGGYKKFSGNTYTNEYGLLVGAAGPAMVLTDFISNETIDWDRFLLLS